MRNRDRPKENYSAFRYNNIICYMYMFCGYNSFKVLLRLKLYALRGAAMYVSRIQHENVICRMKHCSCFVAYKLLLLLLLLQSWFVVWRNESPSNFIFEFFKWNVIALAFLVILWLVRRYRYLQSKTNISIRKNV